MKNGWKAKTLDEVSQFSNGLWKGEKPPFVNVGVIRNTNFTKEGTLDDSDIAYLDVEAKKLEKRRLRFGDIILEKSGGGPKQPVGRVALFDKEDGDFSFSNFTAALRVLDPCELDFRFLHKFLHWTYLSGITEGMQSHSTGIRNLDGDAYKAIRISFPPLTEQGRIVGILDEAFEGIATAKANAEKNLQNARALFESFLNAAIQGRLIPQDSRDTSVAELISRMEKARNVAIDQGRAKPEKTEPKAGNQARLPRSWKWAQLESLTVGISDGVHKRPQYASKGIPFITVKNLTAGPGISFDDLNYITREDHKEFIKRTHPEKGDILITKDGTIGVVRLIETDIEFSIFVSVALIKPVMRELGPYLAYALRAPSVQSQIVPQGAALKHLYLVDLRRLAIPLPPLSEQKRIVDRLDSLDAETQHLEAIYRQKLVALEKLKKSLLHQAFTGEL
jgi:type I restriction enzyme S subunit